MNGALQNLHRLLVFVAVVDRQSVTKAAEDLYLTQPGVSKHIKMLEEAYGVRLLERGHKRLVPTEAGLIIYRYAKNIMRSIEDLNDAMSEFQGAQVGNLVIGASVSAGNYLLPPILGRFKTQVPRAEITLKINVAEQIYQAVKHGDIQVGLAVGANIPADLRVEILFRDELVLVAAPHHPLVAQGSVTIEQLAQQDFIQAPPGSPIDKMMNDELARIGVTPRVVLGLDHPEATKRAVQESLGIALMPSICVDRELAAGDLCPLQIDGVRFSTNYNLISNPDMYQPPLVRRFLDYLRNEVAVLRSNRKGTEPP